MGSTSVSSCRYFMFVSCVHSVAVLNAAFYMTCSVLMPFEDPRDDHMENEYMSVSSCRYCMFVSCVHSVAVLNAAFYMTCSVLMLFEDPRDDHMENEYSRVGLMIVL